MDLKAYIREVPDFPSPGILFRDITPLLADPAAFRYAVDLLGERYQGRNVETIVAIDARGFLLGAPLAYRLGKGLALVRKQGKLPAESLRADYSLEYGASTVEMHSDALTPGRSALVVDDLLATAGTLQATISLVEQAGGKVESVAVLIELLGLKGREKLQGYDIFSLLQYEGA